MASTSDAHLTDVGSVCRGEGRRLKNSIREAFLSLYQGLLKEIQDRKADYRKKRLADLRSRRTGRLSDDIWSFKPGPSFGASSLTENVGLDNGGLEDRMMLLQVNAEGEWELSEVIPLVCADQGPDVFPELPPYEACTSAGCNVLLGDESETLDFIPYAGDPAFPVDQYCSHFSEFGWQHRDCNADDNRWAALGAVKQALSIWDISLEELDEASILPFSLLSVPGQSGLIAWASVR